MKKVERFKWIIKKKILEDFNFCKIFCYFKEFVSFYYYV